MEYIVFVCHGNICRSPVAEVLFNMLNKNDNYLAISRATSYEEIGNDIYPPMKEVLRTRQIPFKRHYATRLTKEEIDKAKYIFYMDDNNLRNLIRQYGPSDKYVLISKYYDNEQIEDPWYTDRFEYVYQKIFKSVEEIVKNI